MLHELQVTVYQSEIEKLVKIQRRATKAVEDRKWFLYWERFNRLEVFWRLEEDAIELYKMLAGRKKVNKE